MVGGARVLCSARGNIVIKICTPALHFPRTAPTACRGMIYAPKHVVLPVSTVSKLHPITGAGRRWPRDPSSGIVTPCASALIDALHVSALSPK